MRAVGPAYHDSVSANVGGQAKRLPGILPRLTLDEALEIKNTAIAEELALPPVKIHCSILAEDAIKAAVADYKKKQGS